MTEERSVSRQRQEHDFLFLVREDSLVSDGGFPTMLPAVMSVRNNAMSRGGGVTCRVDLSSGGISLVSLMEKKKSVLIILQEDIMRIAVCIQHIKDDGQL